MITFSFPHVLEIAIFSLVAVPLVKISHFNTTCRSPEEKVKGHSKANNREPRGHNLNNFGRGPFDDVIY